MKSRFAEIALTLSRVELSILIKATLLMVFGLAAVGIARHARASTRHLLLATTFATLLMLPIAIVAGPRLAVEIPAAQFSNSVGATGFTPSSEGVTQVATNKLAPVNLGNSSWSMPPLATVLRGIWLAGVFLFTIPLAVDFWRVRRLLQNGLPSLRLSDLTKAIANERGVRRHIKVLLHEDVRAPLTCGVWRPVIMMPADADEWTEDNLRRALVHELEHVRRGDWLTQLVSRTVCLFYWFHPLVWVGWRWLRLEAERACDDAVVQTAEHTEYAEQLVMLSRQLSTYRAHSVLGMANRSDLSKRVLALLDKSQRRGPTSLRTVTSVMLIATLAVVSLGSLRAVASNQTQISNVAKTDSSPVDRALVEAADEGSIAEINRLLEAGANVNCIVEGDGTPLIAAARNGHLSAVALLLDRGADPNLQVRGDGNPIIMAAREGHAEIVELLLSRGANINHVVPGDENALIQASGEGHLAVVKLLVGRGADVNVRVWEGPGGTRTSGEWRTPLNRARKGGHTEVINYLLSVGARE